MLVMNFTLILADGKRHLLTHTCVRCRWVGVDNIDLHVLRWGGRRRRRRRREGGGYNLVWKMMDWRGGRGWKRIFFEGKASHALK